MSMPYTYKRPFVTSAIQSIAYPSRNPVTTYLEPLQGLIEARWLRDAYLVIRIHTQLNSGGEEADEDDVRARSSYDRSYDGI